MTLLISIFIKTISRYPFDIFFLIQFQMHTGASQCNASKTEELDEITLRTFKT